MSGLGRIIIGKLLTSNKLTVHLGRPFSTITNNAGIQRQYKWASVVLAVKAFDQKQGNGSIFKDLEAVILYVHGALHKNAKLSAFLFHFSLR